MEGVGRFLAGLDCLAQVGTGVLGLLRIRSVCPVSLNYAIYMFDFTLHAHTTAARRHIYHILRSIVHVIRSERTVFYIINMIHIYYKQICV